MDPFSMNPRERLVHHVQSLERLERIKQNAAENLQEGFEAAKSAGYDPTTLKVVLKLRKLTPQQRRERRALEAIYLAALGMLEGDPLTDEARRRLDGKKPEEPKKPGESAASASDASEDESGEPPADDAPQQPLLALKDPSEARQEGAAAAAAGMRVYDNPYPAGDPCRAAWDEGWCAANGSNGMDTPAAYQRREAKPPKGAGGGAGSGAGGGKGDEGNGADAPGANL